MIRLRKQYFVYRRKTNRSFIIKNIGERIYIKRLNEFAFMLVRFNLQNFIVVPIDRMANFSCVLGESCCVVVVIFYVPHIFLFALFKPAFCFANTALVAVTAICFANDTMPVSQLNCIIKRTW